MDLKSSNLMHFHKTMELSWNCKISPEIKINSNGYTKPYINLKSLIKLINASDWTICRCAFVKSTMQII